MKLSIANYGEKNDLIVNQRKERNGGKKSDKTMKKHIQESMIYSERGSHQNINTRQEERDKRD